jgi:hypothetical protein
MKLFPQEIRRLWPQAQLTSAIGLSGLSGPDGNPASASETAEIARNLDFVLVLIKTRSGAA